AHGTLDSIPTRRSSDLNYGKQPGDAKYRDINNDGTISGEDITIIGSPFPDFYYGFNGTISYKNFDLNVMIQGSQGGKIYNIVARSEEHTSELQSRFDLV